jgi:hypothetical protein
VARLRIDGSHLQIPQYVLLVEVLHSLHGNTQEPQSDESMVLEYVVAGRSDSIGQLEHKSLGFEGRTLRTRPVEQDPNDFGVVERRPVSEDCGEEGRVFDQFRSVVGNRVR